MKRFKYNEEHLKFLAKTFKQCSLKETTKLFNERFDLNKTVEQIKACISNHKIRCGRTGKDKLVEHKKLLNKEQHDYFVKMYKKYPIKELPVKMFNKFGLALSSQQLKSYAANNRIRSGRTGQFQKGHVPATIKLAGTGYLKGSSTSFKKGGRPHNFVEVGTERLTTDGYPKIKVGNPNVWEFKNRLVWKKHHGEIPKFGVIRHLDGDKTNCAIENLFLVNRYEHLALNKLEYNNIDSTIKPTIRAIARIETIIHEKQ